MAEEHIVPDQVVAAIRAGLAVADATERRLRKSGSFSWQLSMSGRQCPHLSEPTAARYRQLLFLFRLEIIEHCDHLTTMEPPWETSVAMW